jgi:hypothetical protein
MARRDARVGVCFLFLQGFEYYHAYNELNLTLNSGLWLDVLPADGLPRFPRVPRRHDAAVVLVRMIRGHFTPDHHFAFEGAAWYWHFVDVVWLGLYVVVYWLYNDGPRSCAGRFRLAGCGQLTVAARPTPPGAAATQSGGAFAWRRRCAAICHSGCWRRRRSTGCRGIGRRTESINARWAGRSNGSSPSSSRTG